MTDTELVGIEDICEMLGRSRQAVWNYIGRGRRHDAGKATLRNPFPLEVAPKLWRRADVEAWHERQPRRWHKPPTTLNPVDARQRYPFAARPLAALLGIPEGVAVLPGFRASPNWDDSTVTIEVEAVVELGRRWMEGAIKHRLTLPSDTMVGVAENMNRYNVTFTGRIDKDVYYDTLRGSRK